MVGILVVVLEGFGPARGGLNQPGHAVPMLVINGLPAVLGAAWFVASG